MKRRPKWSTVTIALAVIAALAIASPVLGISKSIKKVIKKEVSKQIANARGPAGPAGPAGGTGSPAASMLPGFVPESGTPEGTNANTAAMPVGEDTGLTGVESITPNATVVLRDLSVSLGDPPGAGATRTVGVRAGASFTPVLSCSISGTETTCNSGSQTATVPAGTLLQLRMLNNNVMPAESDIKFAYRAVSP